VTPDDKGSSILGESNYAWLKAYMAPVRERVERDNVLQVTRTELLELMSENQKLKRQVAHLSRNDRAAVRLFRRYFA